MEIEYREEDGKDDRIEWWEKDDFRGRTWRLGNRKVGYIKNIREELLKCGECSADLSYPCPVYRGAPLCDRCAAKLLKGKSNRYPEMKHEQ
jgi:hypothetical protein